MNQQDDYQFKQYSGRDAADSEDVVSAVSHVFSNSFGLNPQGKPYRLGPKKTKERLASTQSLFVAQYQGSETIGYLYARVIQYTGGFVGWIDSLAVLPIHRRKKVATRLVSHLIQTVQHCRWIGCATPNPIAALVITRVVNAKTYVGECNPPQEVVSMINEIRPHCPDLRGADFNPLRLLVRTRFTPLSSEDTREWSPPNPSEPPPWWASLENLPSEFEALLILDRGNLPLH